MTDAKDDDNEATRIVQPQHASLRGLNESGFVLSQASPTNTHRKEEVRVPRVAFNALDSVSRISSHYDEDLFNPDMDAHEYICAPDKMKPEEEIDQEAFFRKMATRPVQKRKQKPEVFPPQPNESYIHEHDQRLLDLIRNRLNQSQSMLHSLNRSKILKNLDNCQKVKDKLLKKNLQSQLSLKDSEILLRDGVEQQTFIPVLSLSVNAQRSLVQAETNNKNLTSRHKKISLQEKHVNYFRQQYGYANLHKVLKKRLKKKENRRASVTGDSIDRNSGHEDKEEVEAAQPAWLKDLQQKGDSYGSYCCQWCNNKIFADEDEDPTESQQNEADMEAHQKAIEEEEETNRIRKKYCNLSLNYFSRENPLRLTCIRAQENPWFDRFIILLIFLNSIFLGILDYTWTEDSNRPKPLGNMLTDNSEIPFTVLFTLECVIKLIAMGFILDDGAYLRDGWNWLDFTVVITALIQNLPQVSNVSSLRTFRLFRPLRSLSSFPSMRRLVNTLFLSFQQLSNILILEMFFILTFALFGLQMWGGIIHFRCRKTPHPVNGDWEPVEDLTRVCGAFFQCPADTYCGSLFETTWTDIHGKEVTYELAEHVKADMWRDTSIPELNFGITNFDNFASSYLTIFQCTTKEGWTRVMTIIQDGYSFAAACIFFICFIIICSYFLLNLTVAVMLDNFQSLNEQNNLTLTGRYEENRLRLQKLKNVCLFLEEICESHIDDQPGQVQKRSSMSKVILKWFCEIPDVPEDNQYQYKICSISFKIINFPIFNYFIMLFIILNTVCLATDSYPEKDYKSTIASLNTMFTIIFTLETLLKMLGLTYEKFIEDNFNIFDAVIVLASLIEMGIADGGAGVVSALRALRLVRLIKLARSNLTLRALLDSIGQTIKAIGNFLVLLGIFVYVFALLGMSMFAGTFKFDPRTGLFDRKGDVPRQNFDSLEMSLITVFQILIGEKWQLVMYMAILSNGYMATIYFVMLILLGQFSMLNLFLAILLGNFELASLMTQSNKEEEILKQYEDQIVQLDLLITTQRTLNELVDKGVGLDDKQRLERFEFLSELSKKDMPNHEKLHEIRAASQHIMDQLQDKIKKQLTQMMMSKMGGMASLKKSSSLALSIQDSQKPQLQAKAASQLVLKEEELLPNMVLQDKQENQIDTDPDFQNLELEGGDKTTVSEGLNALFKKKTVQQHDDLELNSALSIDTLSNKGSARIIKSKSGARATESRRDSVGSKAVMAGLQNLKSKIELKNALVQKNKNKDEFDDSDIDYEEFLRDQINQQVAKERQMTTFRDERSNSVISDGQQAISDIKLGKMERRATERGFPPLNTQTSEGLQTDRSLLNQEEKEQQEMDELSLVTAPSKIKQFCSSRKESSCFLLHKDNCLRKMLIMMTMKPKEQQIKSKRQQILQQMRFMNNDEDSDSDDGQTESQKEKSKQNQKSKMQLNQGSVADRKRALEKKKQREANNKKSRIAQLLNDFDFADPQVNFGKALYVSESELMQKVGKTKQRGSLVEGDESMKQAKTLRQSVKSGEASPAISPSPMFGDATPTFDDSPDIRRKMYSAAKAWNTKIQPLPVEMANADQKLKSEEDDDKGKVREEELTKRFEEIIERGGSVEELENLLRTEVSEAAAAVQEMHAKNEIDRRALIEYQESNREAEVNLKALIDKSRNQIYLRNQMATCSRTLRRNLPCLKWKINKWFETLVLVAIMMSIVLLIIDSPLEDPNSDKKKLIEQIDGAVGIFFVFEALARILAEGFFVSSIPGQKGYIMNGQNQIDFLAGVVCELVSLVARASVGPGSREIDSTLRSLKILRSLRALRPLRVISRSESLQVAVGSLGNALPAIGNGVIVCSLILLLYAIVGISLFKGRFWYCVPKFETGTEYSVYLEAQRQKISHIKNQEQCLEAGCQWVNRLRNFDDIWAAICVLWEIMTTEGWLDVMYYAVDSTGISSQPRKNANVGFALFFVSYLIVGNIFVLNLFVGIVIDKFNRLKDHKLGFALMTKDQRDWILQEKQMVRLSLEPLEHPPENYWLNLAFVVSKHRYFDNFISICIILSATCQSVIYYQMPTEYAQALAILRNILTLIYNLEAIIKIVADGLSYFNQSWNRFDFFIVCIADLAFIFDFFFTEQKTVGKILNIIKALRILRILRLIRFSRDLRVLVDSLLVILPPLANVGALIFLLLFIYSIIGMALFSNVILQKELNENFNFQSFGMAIMLLVKCATGEGWNQIMRELAVTKEQEIVSWRDGKVLIEHCKDNQSFEDLTKNGPKGCGTSFSYAYFASFIIIIHAMMLNLFIAVVLEGFSSTNKEHTGVVTSGNYAEFIQKWLTYDQEATGWINVSDLIFLLLELESPLGRGFDPNIEPHVNSQQTEDRTEAQEGQLVDRNKRYVVKMEKNLTITFRAAMHLLDELSLPVYKTSDPKIFQCHISHVLKRTTFLTMRKENKDFDPFDIEVRHFKKLKEAWEAKYPSLVKRNEQDLVENYDTGRIWAGQFIALCIRCVVAQRKLSAKQAAYNWHARERKDRDAAEKQKLEELEAKLNIAKNKDKKNARQSWAYRRKRYRQIAVKRMKQRQAGIEVTDEEINWSADSDEEKGQDKREDSNDSMDLKDAEKEQERLIKQEERAKRRREGRATADDLRHKIDEQRKAEEERAKQADDEFAKLLKSIIKGERRTTAQEEAAAQHDKKVETMIDKLGAGMKNLVQKTQQEELNEEKEDKERSTWHMETGMHALKMQRWVKNQYVRDRLLKLKKEGAISRLDDLKKLDLRELFAEEIELMEQDQKKSAVNSDIMLNNLSSLMKKDRNNASPKSVGRKSRPRSSKALSERGTQAIQKCQTLQIENISNLMDDKPSPPILIAKRDRKLTDIMEDGDSGTFSPDFAQKKLK